MLYCAFDPGVKLQLTCCVVIIANMCCAVNSLKNWSISWMAVIRTQARLNPTTSDGTILLMLP